MHKNPEESIVKAADVITQCDALSAEELDLLPELRNISERDHGVLAMIACGYPQADVGAAFGITQQAVHAIIKKIDPNGVYRLTPDAKRAFVSKLAEGRAMSALSMITAKGLSECTPVEKMRIAKMGFEISQSLNQGKHKTTSVGRLDSLLEQIENERLSKIPEAEVREVDE